MRIELKINPPTSTAQQKQYSRFGGVYETPNARKARKELMVALAPFAPREPLNEALRCEIQWRFRIKDKKKNWLPKTTRPDLDNLEKMLLDCMQKLGYYKDDALIVNKFSSKYWVYEEKDAGITIQLEKWND